MIDTTSQQPLTLDPFDLEQPYMVVPDVQLRDVEELLTKHGIQFTTRENLVSFDDGPFYATIIFQFGADRQMIQSVLDSAN